MTKYGCTGRSKLELWLESKLKELYPTLDITYNNREVDKTYLEEITNQINKKLERLDR